VKPTIEAFKNGAKIFALSGKYRPASVRFTAYSRRQTEAGVGRALIARLKAAEFLALRGGC
jgi:hypothetical protein